MNGQRRPRTRPAAVMAAVGGSPGRDGPDRPAGHDMRGRRVERERVKLRQQPGELCQPPRRRRLTKSATTCWRPANR